jgi:predicted RNA-binding protein YlxR (DUF448 family)
MQQALLTRDDRDSSKAKTARERTCIVTHEAKPVSELIRFVLSPGGALTPDLKLNLPGRGVWVSARRATMQMAVKRNSFSQALKVGTKADPFLPDMIGELLKTRALSALSLANKAGEVISGALKIEKAISGKMLALLHATDGAADGSAKLDRRFRSVYGQKAQIFTLFGGEELDVALGRGNVIHAALMQGNAAEACLQGLLRLAAYEISEVA